MFRPQEQCHPAANPCIGVIVIGPPDENGSRYIWAYHFDGGDDIQSTLFRDRPDGIAFVFGGNDNNPDSSTDFAETVKSLERMGVQIGGVLNSIGLWADRDGNLYIRDNLSEIAIGGLCADDGTLVPRVREND